jgi:hypothetical protein
MKEEAARTIHGGILKTGQTPSNPVKLNEAQSNRIKPDQTGSNQIKPNQTCWLVCPPSPYVGGYARRRCGCATFAAYRGYFPGLASIKANQAESNQIKPVGRVGWAEI